MATASVHMQHARDLELLSLRRSRRQSHMINMGKRPIYGRRARRHADWFIGQIDKGKIDSIALKAPKAGHILDMSPGADAQGKKSITSEGKSRLVISIDMAA